MIAELLKAYELSREYIQASIDEFGRGKGLVQELDEVEQRISELKASPIKRFALLAGETYYPSPGWYGFDSWHDTTESAVEKGQQIASESLMWYQVLDTHDFKIVAGSGEAHTGLFGKVSCAVSPIHHVFSDNEKDTKDSRWETATLKEILRVVGQTAAECPDAVFTIVEI